MGVLFFASDVRQPSVAWLRRMLAGLRSDVAALVTERPLGEPWETSYPCAVTPYGAGAMWQGMMRRLGWAARRRASAAQVAWMAERAARADVDSVLVQYATLALTYEQAWRRIRKPVFVHCHGYDVTWDLRSHEHPQRGAHAADYPERVRRMSDHVRFIANSRVTRDRLLSIGVPAERMNVKYLGVCVPDSPPQKCFNSQPPNTRDNAEVRVLYLGRLIDCKGPDLTIQAFDLACQRGMRGRLIVAGEGPLKGECERLRAASAHAERIELLGAVDENTAEGLRARADIFTAHNRTGPLTRQEEAFGVSLVEAMAAGLPIVSGNNGSLPELIDDGVQGILFPPGDAPAHAAALLRLAGDAALRREMGRRGWERARERFRIEEEMLALRELLRLAPQARPEPVA